MKIRYQMATVMNPFYCRVCWNANPRIKKSFAMEICTKVGIFPYFRVPHWGRRLQAAIIKHYKECHPEWEVY